ncbi:MAG: chemotaxis protein CheB [Polyangia bacterium]
MSPIIVVIGGSAGGLTALLQLVAMLPRELPAALLAVLHISPDSPSNLAGLLQARSLLPASEAVHGEPLRAGHIYLAPPDFHVLVQATPPEVAAVAATGAAAAGAASSGALGRIVLSHGPRENRSRPAIDPLFRSAARAFGPRVVGVLLSGKLDDGTTGLLAIKARGGVALVQDPDEAQFPSMVQSAVDHVRVDGVLGVNALASRIVALATAPRDPEPPTATLADDLLADRELASTLLTPSTLVEPRDHPGTPSGFGCPECGGALWELTEEDAAAAGEGGFLRYRCRTGHALTAHSLLTAQSDKLEEALWTALRALEEKIALSHTLAARNRGIFRASLIEDAEDAKRHAEVLRQMLSLEEFHINE